MSPRKRRELADLVCDFGRELAFATVDRAAPHRLPGAVAGDQNQLRSAAPQNPALLQDIVGPLAAA